MKDVGNRRDFRNEVTTFLGLLADDVTQRLAFPKLSAAELTAKLCRLWFDEIYVPSTSYVDGLKGDMHPEAVCEFESFFTAEERSDLERFHQCLMLRMNMLPEGSERFASFSARDSWKHVQRDAARLFEQLSRPAIAESG